MSVKVASCHSRSHALLFVERLRHFGIESDVVIHLEYAWQYAGDEIECEVHSVLVAESDQARARTLLTPDPALLAQYAVVTSLLNLLSQPDAPVEDWTREPFQLFPNVLESRTHAWAREVFRWAGDAAIGPLARSLETVDLRWREVATQLLVAMGTEVIPTLARLWEECNDAKVRTEIVNILQRIGSRSALPVILSGLGSDSSQVVEASKRALCQIGLDNFKQARGTVDRLENKYEIVRCLLQAKALGYVESGDVYVLPLLIRALGESDPNIRGSACHALEQLGRSAEPALPNLRAIASSDADGVVRRMALNAIRRIEG